MNLKTGLWVLLFSQDGNFVQFQKNKCYLA